MERINEIDRASVPALADAETGWTDRKNARRCELVDREIDSTLTAGERRELRGLQAEFSKYRQAIAPLPIKELRDIYDGLRREAEHAHAETLK